jgi:hypothetical protein
VPPPRSEEWKNFNGNMQHVSRPREKLKIFYFDAGGEIRPEQNALKGFLDADYI